jgi:hypothetical protein
MLPVYQAKEYLRFDFLLKNLSQEVMLDIEKANTLGYSRLTVVKDSFETWLNS